MLCILSLVWDGYTVDSRGLQLTYLVELAEESDQDLATVDPPPPPVTVYIRSGNYIVRTCGS
jgi:hypothetical protein